MVFRLLVLPGLRRAEATAARAALAMSSSSLSSLCTSAAETATEARFRGVRVGPGEVRLFLRGDLTGDVGAEVRLSEGACEEVGVLERLSDEEYEWLWEDVCTVSRSVSEPEWMFSTRSSVDDEKGV